MNKKLSSIALMLFSFISNFFIYNYSFNEQATPFLSEEQRVESGLLMLNTTLPAYAISSIVIVLLAYWLFAKR